MEIKTRILEATIEEFNESGLKFTMDDLAKRLGMSKKTIYQCVPDKKTLFLEMVDYIFDGIKESEREVYEHQEWDCLEKLKRILIVLPKRYENIDFGKLYALKEDYPQIYKKIEQRLDSGWELTIELLEQAKAEGKIRAVPLPVLKAMLEGTIEKLLSCGQLEQAGLSYKEALFHMLDILMNGMIKDKNESGDVQ